MVDPEFEGFQMAGSAGLAARTLLPNAASGE
jgi:hypothetical protein